jgi:hypothetical protein
MQAAPLADISVDTLTLHRHATGWAGIKEPANRFFVNGAGGPALKFLKGAGEKPSLANHHCVSLGKKKGRRNRYGPSDN